jgi:hypothetical protein
MTHRNLDLDIPSILARARDYVLRVSSSDVSAIAGYHPFRNLCELFEKYVYQDIPELLELDAENLGLEVVNKDDEVDRILVKLSDCAEVRKLTDLKRKAGDVDIWYCRKGAEVD